MTIRLPIIAAHRAKPRPPALFARPKGGLTNEIAPPSFDPRWTVSVKLSTSKDVRANGLPTSDVARKVEDDGLYRCTFGSVA